LWKKGELAAFFNRAGIGDRVAFFMAFAALLEEKAEAERERIARDRVVDELLKRRAETRATIAELAAIMKAIEPRAIEEHPADTLIALQRRRAGNSAVTRRGKREAWLGELKKSTNDMRGRNPALTDDDILDKLIGPGGSWPPGIWHPSRGYMKTGFTLLYKEKKITPRSKTPLPR
jgi:hypothetical protein